MTRLGHRDSYLWRKHRFKWGVIADFFERWVQMGACLDILLSWQTIIAQHESHFISSGDVKV